MVDNAARGLALKVNNSGRKIGSIAGNNSNAEGNNTIASGSCSHSEGYMSVAGLYSAYANITSFDDVSKKVTFSTAHGFSNQDTVYIFDIYSMSFIISTITQSGIKTFTLDTTETITSSWKYAVKFNTDDIAGSHSEGGGTSSIGLYSHAEGVTTLASGDYSHAEGGLTTSSGVWSHSEGSETISSEECSHAEGYGTTASGLDSHAEGTRTVASGECSHAEGSFTTASGDYSHSEGVGTDTSVYASHIQGQYNKDLVGNATTYSATADALVIGNGTNISALSNAFRVTFDGKTYGLSAFNSTGADYSEYFEWLDGNVNNEDRVGKFVTIDGKKIKFANDGDYILGITSSTPAIIGDSASESWSNRYVTDIFRRIQYHDVAIPEQTTTITNRDGTTEEKIISEAHTELQPIYNPNYDPTKENEYINREKRKEWSTVGLLGKLIVIDDGTCEVNGYCKPSNGIAIKSTAGYRVMERLDNNHIMALIK